MNNWRYQTSTTTRLPNIVERCHLASNQSGTKTHSISYTRKGVPALRKKRPYILQQQTCSSNRSAKKL